MKNPDNSVKAPIFSKTELEVVKFLTRGYSEKEIADKMHVSPHTVNNHMRNIREKNGLTKNTEVILAYIAYIKGKPFSLAKVRELGILAVLVLTHVCVITEVDTENGKRLIDKERNDAQYGYTYNRPNVDGLRYVEAVIQEAASVGNEKGKDGESVPYAHSS